MEHEPTPPDNLPSLPDNLPSPPTGMEASADEEEILHSWYQQRRMIWETEQNEPDNGDLESVMDGEMDGDSTDGEEYPDWDAYESGEGLSSWDQLGESYEQDAAGVGFYVTFADSPWRLRTRVRTTACFIISCPRSSHLSFRSPPAFSCVRKIDQKVDMAKCAKAQSILCESLHSNGMALGLKCDDHGRTLFCTAENEGYLSICDGLRSNGITLVPRKKVVLYNPNSGWIDFWVILIRVITHSVAYAWTHSLVLFIMMHVFVIIVHLLI
ncbi:hypothetical protein BDZ97DRAFT_1767603 [Flammula alnicola]|nr:hypothetical protein BDZ97DRAFT_1767603 [Flammula alnicola]